MSVHEEEPIEELEKKFGPESILEMTPEECLENLKKQEYGVRVMQNEDFFHTKELWSPKEKLIQDIKDSITVGKETEKKEIGTEIVQLGEKLLTIICAYDFQKTGDIEKWNQALEHGKACGWDALKNEGWRIPCVAKASNATIPQATKAVERTDDLEEATKIAPRQLMKLPPLQGEVPDIRTKRRIKIKMTE